MLAVLACSPAAAGVQPRVVKGSEVGIQTYPFQVSLRFGASSAFICGGSILDATHIVTAAHCVTSGDPPQPAPAGSFKVGYGSDYLSQQSLKNVQTIDVAPGYLAPSPPNADPSKVAPFDASYDAALLTLTSPIDLSGPNAKAIKLADPAQVRTSGSAIVSGWGSTSEGGAPTNTLKAARVPLATASPCEAQYGLTPSGYNDLFASNDDPYFFASARHVCAGGGPEAQNADTCQGDSGGPLVVDLDPSASATNFVLLGLTSFGDGCGRTWPAVYAWTQAGGIASTIDPGGLYTSTQGPGAPDNGPGTPGVVARTGSGSGSGGGSATGGSAGVVNPPTSSPLPAPTTAARDTTRPTARVAKISCTKKRKCGFRVSATDTGGAVTKLSATVSRKVRICKKRGAYTYCRVSSRTKTLKPKRVAGGFTFSASLVKATYKLTAVATDAAGNRSTKLSKTFRVR